MIYAEWLVEPTTDVTESGQQKKKNNIFIFSPHIQFLNWSTASLQADSRLAFFKPHRGTSSLGLIAHYLTNGGLGCTVRQEISVKPEFMELMTDLGERDRGYFPGSGWSASGSMYQDL